MTAVEGGFLRGIARRCGSLEYFLPDATLAPAGKTIVDGLGRAVFARAVLPAASDLQNMHDAAQNTTVILAFGTRLVRRKVGNDLRPLRIAEPKKTAIRGLTS